MSQGVRNVEHMFDMAVLDRAPTPVPDDTRPGGALVTAAAAFRRAALEVDVADLSDDELLELAPLVERVRRAAEAVLGSSLGELDVRGTTDERFGHRTAHWFSLTVNCSVGEARRRVQVGRRLRRLELTLGAFADGSVSFEHAKVLTDLATPRNAHLVAELERELLGLANVMAFARWKAEVQGLVDLADADGGFRPGPEGSTLRLTAGFGGSLELAGTLAGEHGQVVREALERTADRLALRYRREVQAGTRDTVPTRAELLAEALTDLVRRGVAAGHAGKGPVTELTLVAHAHDPLGTRNSNGARHGSSGPDPATVPSPVHTARGGCDHHGALHADMSDATARTLCCDPVVRTVVLDSLGNPVDLGRTTRLVPKGLRRALEVRDGGCVFPGCDAPSSWCDAHHVAHWSDGGSTSAENLGLLCRHHHGVTHRSGWNMAADPDRPQRFTWTRPDGTVLHSQRRSDQTPPPGHSPPRE